MLSTSSSLLDTPAIILYFQVSIRDWEIYDLDVIINFNDPYNSIISTNE